MSKIPESIDLRDGNLPMVPVIFFDDMTKVEGLP